MVLDRRLAREIAQALLRARNKEEGGDIFKNTAQTSTVLGEGGYGEPGFGRAASQLPRLIPAPRPHPFRDLRKFSYNGDGADIAKARVIPAYDPLASKVAPRTLSRQEDSQSIHGRPSEVNAGYGTEHKPTGGHPTEGARLNGYPTPNAARKRAVGLAQMGLGETGTHQSPERSNDPRNHPGPLRRQSSGHDGTAKANPPGHSADILRLGDGEPDAAKQAPHKEHKMPKVHYPTAGEMVSEFLGGIGKGIAQPFADIVFEDAKARLATVEGIYIDTPNPDLFGPPTSPWDHDGRMIAQPMLVTIRKAPLRKPRTWAGKIIGKVTPPKDLKPGTVPFGNYMHEKIEEFLKASFPKTTFGSNVKRGQRGPDMPHHGGLMPGASYLEIKPNKPHSEKQLGRQIRNWGHEESTVRAISYDEQGNIYDGFGY